MEFHGSKRKYKLMLAVGAPLALFLFVLASILQQGNEFSFVNLVLFVSGSFIAGGFVAMPVVYLLGRDRKVVLTDNEIKLMEGRKPKGMAYHDIRDLKMLQNRLDIKSDKRKMLVYSMHDYPLQDIYEQLNKKLDGRDGGG